MTTRPILQSSHREAQRDRTAQEDLGLERLSVEFRLPFPLEMTHRRTSHTIPVPQLPHLQIRETEAQGSGVTQELLHRRCYSDAEAWAFPIDPPQLT